MCSNTIPSSVDCIILGTGLTNSIVAAACSRIGKTILHLDKNTYYGDHWASFTFQQLVDWIKLNHPEQQPDCLTEMAQELLDKKSRMFCIDLCPRLLFSTGAMVELLVKSNVSRYHEFKNNIRILSMVDNEIHVIPCRRSEVFNSPLLTDLIDKRKLMKFIEQCIKFDPAQDSSTASLIAESAEQPILDYLESQGLSNALKQYIINSIAMVEPTVTTREACENIKKFMFSTERFGRSPFLFPLYGCGEFPQSFCRLSAVFGGIYCLNSQIDMVQELDSSNHAGGDSNTNQREKFCVRFSNNEQEVRSHQLVQDHETAFELSRAILITRSSVVKNEENLLSFLRIPPRKDLNNNLISLIELNASVMVCPPDINIVYMWTRRSPTSDTAECDLRPTVEKIFDKESIVWSFYYHQQATTDLSDDLDYTVCIQEARKIFSEMYPDEEFLPRAPDPDEIIA